MAVSYLKRANRTPETESGGAQRVVAEMLADIVARGEQSVRDHALRLDHWSGPIVLTPDAIGQRIRGIPPATRRDIEYATAQVRRFAITQRDSLREFSTEIAPGLIAGQRLVPCNVAGCYVPTGRYAHIASAY
ncbi:MAG: histidinol dehydrogenase, partial [Betaproteobacteria bacterium]